MLLPQIIGGLLQEKPKVPEFNAIDPSIEAGKATAGNIANFGGSSDLAGMVNQFNSDQMRAMLEKTMPGYFSKGNAMLGTSEKLITSYLHGQLPQDVKNRIGMSAAQRSVSGGFAGSGMARNLEARDLGLTSLDLTGKGLDAASRWLGDAERFAGSANTGFFDVSRMFISPTEQIRTSMWNTENKFNRDWVSNQLDAEYSLGSTVGRAMIKTDDQIMQIISSVAGSAGGAMMGG